jgi:hypothetical protein
MRNVSKCIVPAVFLIMAVLSPGQAALAATATVPSGGLLAIDVCGCCPPTCGGGTLIGCFNTIDMPPNAVTCVYSGKVGACVNCLLADPVKEAYNAIFGEAGATCPQAAG